MTRRMLYEGGYMMRKKLVIFFMLLVSLVLVLSACSSSTSDEADETEKDQETSTETNDDEKDEEEVVTSGGDLKIAVSAQPPTMDPLLTTATVAIDITRNIFETLVASNENYETVPMLAESVDVSDDGKTYTFKLRQGVKFHNGDEMKAEDVEASMNRWLENSARAKMLLEGGEFKAVDDYTVEFTIPFVASDTLDIMAGQGQFPAIMPKEVVEGAQEDGVQEIIGTGPFKFEEWKQDQYVRLSKFDDYSAREEERSGFVGKKEALVDNVYYYFVQDSATRLAGLQTGEYHLTDSMPYDNYEQILALDNAEAHVFLDGSLNMFYNKKEGIMSDAKMRQMVNAVIESDSVMRASFANEDLYIISNSFMNPESATWATDAGKESYNQDDPEKAQQIAKEAGYNGEPIRLLATRDYDHHYNASIVVKEQLEQAGFNVTLDIFDWPTLLENREDPAKWDIFFTGTGYVTTPSQLLALNSSYAGWTSDPKIDELLIDIRSALTQEEAFEKWEELQTFMWNEYLPTTLFGHYTRIVGASKNLVGFEAFEGIIPWGVAIQE